MNKVLLIDDDRDFRKLIVSVLQPHAIEVVEAATCAVADGRLGQGAFDLILVDGLLPDGRGVQWIERLRQRDKETRVVFLSAFWRDLRTFEHLTRNLDVSLVLYKPIDAVELVPRLVQLMEISQQPVAADPAAQTFALELEKLRKEFESNLPNRLTELEEEASAARTDPARKKMARSLAHRLRGSSGTFGFGGVGEAVGVIEDLLNDVELSPAPLSESLWGEIRQSLANARRLLDGGATPPVVGTTEVAAPPRPPILVLDGDPDAIQFIRKAARQQSTEVLTAQTPAAALQLAAHQPLLGVLIDAGDATEASIAFGKRLRATPGNENVPIAFASDDARLDVRMAAITGGASRFIEKPYTMESFAALNQHFLALARAEQGRVLIVDDDDDIVRAYAARLERAGYRVEALTSADTLLVRLEEFRPDVLLLDVGLPRVSGVDVCRALRMSDRWQLLPIIVITGTADPATRVRAFRAGASDVIGKPLVMEELLARVGVHVERLRLQRERADKDALTGLLLRRAFVEAFQRSLSGCLREKKPLSVVLLDIDHFKQVNDQYGHIAGDQVLARLGSALQRRFRAEDLRGRWGGEEFIVVFAGQAPAFATQAAEKLLEDFREMLFISDGGDSFAASFTAGVASYPEDGTTISALVRRADERLYLGKQRGRDRVVRSEEGGTGT